MPAELFKVKLSKDLTDRWGFKMTGGKEELLVISEVTFISVSDL